MQCSLKESLYISGKDGNETLSCLKSFPAHMRGEDHVVEGVERVVGFRRLSFLNVKAFACDLVLFKRFDLSRPSSYTGQTG